MWPIAEAAIAAVDISNASTLLDRPPSKGIQDWGVGNRSVGKHLEMKA